MVKIVLPRPAAQAVYGGLALDRSARVRQGVFATSRGRTGGCVGSGTAYFLTLTLTVAVTAGFSGSCALSTNTT